MSEKRQKNGDNRRRPYNGQTNKSYVAKSAAPVKPVPVAPVVKPQPTPVQPSLNFVGMLAGILGFFRLILSYSPIKGEWSKKERLIKVNVVGFEWMSVEWTDYSLVVFVVLINILIDVGLVVLHMSTVTIAYYLAALTILSVGITSIVFRDKHGYKYPVMVGVIIATMAGIYSDFSGNLKNGNSFVYVCAFVLVYKFVVEPVIEAVKRLFGPKTELSATHKVDSTTPVSASPVPPEKAVSAEPPVPALLSYADAVKVIMSKVQGAADNWNVFRDAIVATFRANYPQIGKTIEAVGTEIQNWEGGSFDELVQCFGIVDKITRPNLPVAPTNVAVDPLLPFLDLQYTTDRVLQLVRDWPKPLTEEVVGLRRDDLAAAVEAYARLVDELPQTVMAKFTTTAFAQSRNWDYTWAGLLDIIDNAILDVQSESANEEEPNPTSIPVPVPVVNTNTPDLTVWQQVLKKADWSITDSAKIAFMKAILNPVAAEVGWMANDEENFVTLWQYIEDEPGYLNPFDKRDRTVRDQANQATIDWLLSKLPVPA